MAVTIRIHDSSALLDTDLIASNGEFGLNDAYAGLLLGMGGTEIASQSPTQVVLISGNSDLDITATTSGVDLAVESFPSNFGLKNGTVHSISLTANIGAGFVDFIEFSDLTLDASATLSTIIGYVTGKVSGGDQIILANEDIRYFGSSLDDVFEPRDKGFFGERLTLLGNDYLDLGAGNDRFYGDAGDDYMYGRTGQDSLRGGHGDDAIFGGLGADTLMGEHGDDRVVGGADADIIFGGAGFDVLIGGNGKDKLSGGVHQDQLMGGGGNDDLFGGRQNDTLTGGKGRDDLFGGYGADLFVFNDASGKDVIHDYAAGKDLLDITTENTVTTEVETNGIRVSWGEQWVLVTGIFDVADLVFI